MPPDRIVSLLDSLFESFDRDDAPGLIVGVVREDRTLYCRAFGLASIEHGVPNTLATRMPVGSITKQFTCLAALLLAERRKLVLDDSIRKWLPELPELAGAPSLRQLMQHLSGYRDYLDTAFADAFALKPAGETLAFQCRQTTVNHAPGAAQIYSNSGYFLLSLAMERAAGKPFEDVLDELIFKPLSLRQTESVRNDWPVRRGIATGYVSLPEGGYRAGVSVSEERLGEGAIVSTVDDLLSWASELRAVRLIGSDAVWQAMKQPARLQNGESSSYGGGLQIKSYRGARTLGHGGNVMGATSQILVLPDHALDIVIVANHIVAAERLAQRIVDIVLDGVLSPVPSRPRTAEFGDLLGAWRTEQHGLLLRFVDIDGQLGLSQFGGPPAHLEATAGDENLPFVLPTAVGTMRFSREAQFENSLITVHDSGRRVVFERSDESIPSLLEVAAEVCGSYRCDDIQTRLVIETERDVLVMRCCGAFGRNRLLIAPLAADLLGAQHELMPFFAIFKIVREHGAVARLLYSTPRTWALPFVRETAR